jgi:hypothetical protein
MLTGINPRPPPPYCHQIQKVLSGGMQRICLDNQLSARGTDLAPLRRRGWPHETPLNGRRRSFEGFTMGLH